MVGRSGLPFLRDLGPSYPGLLVELGSTVLITSCGTGALPLPMRMGSPSELAMIWLQRLQEPGIQFAVSPPPDA